MTIVLQVKGLAFNQLSPNLLASGGADGDIIIWDVANPKKPTAFPPLKASFACVATASVTFCFTCMWVMEVVKENVVKEGADSQQP